MAEAIGLAASILTITAGVIEGIKYAKTCYGATEGLEALQLKGTLEAILRLSFHGDGQIKQGLHSYHFRNKSCSSPTW